MIVPLVSRARIEFKSVILTVFLVLRVLLVVVVGDMKLTQMDPMKTPLVHVKTMTTRALVS